MKLSPLALAILEFVEELKFVAYPDQHGVWTCGYGHTGPDVVQGTTCTFDMAGLWLAQDVLHAENAVSDFIKVPVSQRQFDALVLLQHRCFGVCRLEPFASIACRQYRSCSQ